MSFTHCHRLVSVVFGEHSNITNLGECAFSNCSALTSITLPDKLEVIEEMAFHTCTSLMRVVFNKNLKKDRGQRFWYVHCAQIYKHSRTTQDVK